MVSLLDAQRLQVKTARAAKDSLLAKPPADIRQAMFGQLLAKLRICTRRHDVDVSKNFVGDVETQCVM